MPRFRLVCIFEAGGAAPVSLFVGPQYAMTITDSKLKDHVEQVVRLMSSLPEELCPVCGLMDGCHYFGLVGGVESPQAREALEPLVSAELRPALRQWYQRFGSEMNPAALEFRERLSDLAGERFG